MGGPIHQRERTNQALYEAALYFYQLAMNQRQASDRDQEEVLREREASLKEESRSSEIQYDYSRPVVDQSHNKDSHQETKPVVVNDLTLYAEMYKKVVMVVTNALKSSLPDVHALIDELVKKGDISSANAKELKKVADKVHNDPNAAEELIQKVAQFVKQQDRRSYMLDGVSPTLAAVVNAAHDQLAREMQANGVMSFEEITTCVMIESYVSAAHDHMHSNVVAGNFAVDAARMIPQAASIDVEKMLKELKKQGYNPRFFSPDALATLVAALPENSSGVVFTPIRLNR